MKIRKKNIFLYLFAFYGLFLSLMIIADKVTYNSITLSCDKLIYLLYSISILTFALIYGLSCFFILKRKEWARKTFLFCAILFTLSESSAVIHAMISKSVIEQMVLYSYVLRRTISMRVFILESAFNIFISIGAIYYFTRTKIKELFLIERKF